MLSEAARQNTMKCAELYSLDGVVFSNLNPFSFDAIKEIFQEDPLLYRAPAIHTLDRTPEKTLFVPPAQIGEYASQLLCQVLPEAWQYLWSRQEVDIYGNTGRPNKTPWIQLTERTIEQGNLRTRFKDIFYRPKDVSSIESKGEAILQMLETYDTVTHYDNNPWVIFGLARKIPRAKFVLVQSQNKGTLYSQAQADAFGNVKVEWRLAYKEEPDDGKKKPKKRQRYRSYFEDQERQRRSQKNSRI